MSLAWAAPARRARIAMNFGFG